MKKEGELALLKIQLSVFWSSTKQTSSLPDLAEKFFTWHKTIITH